jgi:hypothetical protein
VVGHQVDLRPDLAAFDRFASVGARDGDGDLSAVEKMSRPAIAHEQARLGQNFEGRFSHQHRHEPRDRFAIRSLGGQGAFKINPRARIFVRDSSTTWTWRTISIWRPVARRRSRISSWSTASSASLRSSSSSWALLAVCAGASRGGCSSPRAVPARVRAGSAETRIFIGLLGKRFGIESNTEVATGVVRRMRASSSRSESFIMNKASIAIFAAVFVGQVGLAATRGWADDNTATGSIKGQVSVTGLRNAENVLV